MSPVICHDWNEDDEFYCAHCLTEQDRWDTRCYRCDASFQGAGRYDKLSGKPHTESLLHHG